MMKANEKPKLIRVLLEWSDSGESFYRWLCADEEGYRDGCLGHGSTPERAIESWKFLCVVGNGGKRCGVRWQ